MMKPCETISLDCSTAAVLLVFAYLEKNKAEIWLLEDMAKEGVVLIRNVVVIFNNIWQTGVLLA